MKCIILNQAVGVSEAWENDRNRDKGTQNQFVTVKVKEKSTYTWWLYYIHSTYA